MQVGNFRVEPPGLFRGRGEHPKVSCQMVWGKEPVGPWLLKPVRLNLGAPDACSRCGGALAACAWGCLSTWLALPD